MGLFSKVTSFLKREAKDIGDAADDLKDRVDDELTRREAELDMTPSEKISAIQEQATQTDQRFDEIAAKAQAQAAGEEADASLPNITHIVLPDGRVRSGDDPMIPPPIEPPEAHEVAPEAAPAPEPPRPEPELGSLEWVTQEPTPQAPPPEPEVPAPAAAPPPPPAPAAETPPPPVVATPPPAQPTAPATETSPAPPAAAPTGEQVESAESEAPRIADDENFAKTPAQLKYEKAREAANALLEELRGELKSDGEI